MTNSTDLLKGAQSGDINAFHSIFAEFQPQLKSYLYRLTANRNDSEDLTHDTFVRAFDKCRDFKGNSSFKTWVFRIGTNLAIDMLRKQKRWPEDAQDRSKSASQESPHIVNSYLHINQYSPAGKYEIKEHIDFCFTCLSKTLPIEQQVTLLLKDVYSFKVKEIAIILQFGIGKVKHLLHDARQMMIQIFDNRCSLVSKKGVCYQCSELNGLFNPQRDAQIELVEIEMVKESGQQAKENLYELRTQLVRAIDPLNANGSDLHDFILQRIATVLGHK